MTSSIKNSKDSATNHGAIEMSEETALSIRDYDETLQTVDLDVSFKVPSYNFLWNGYYYYNEGQPIKDVGRIDHDPINPPTNLCFTNVTLKIERRLTPREVQINKVAAAAANSILATHDANSLKQQGLSDTYQGIYETASGSPGREKLLKRALAGAEVLDKKYETVHESNYDIRNTVRDASVSYWTSPRLVTTSNNFAQSLISPTRPTINSVDQTPFRPQVSFSLKDSTAIELNKATLESPSPVDASPSQVMNMTYGVSTAYDLGMLNSFRALTRNNRVLSGMTKYCFVDSPDGPYDDRYNVVIGKNVKQKVDISLVVSGVKIPNKSSTYRISVYAWNQAPGKPITSGNKPYTQKKSIDVSLDSLIDSFESMQYEPNASLSYPAQDKSIFSISVDGLAKRSPYQSSKYFQRESSRVSKFNVYVKSLGKAAAGARYEFVGSLQNKQSGLYSIKTQLGLVRVIAVDDKGQESKKYRDFVVGRGYSYFSELVIVPSYSRASAMGNSVTINVYGIPSDAKLVIKRRSFPETSVTDAYPEITRASSRVVVYSGTTDSKTAGSLTVADDVSSLAGKGYLEYNAYLHDLSGALLTVSNIATIRTPHRDVEGLAKSVKSVTIDQGSASSTINVDGTRDISFDITTSLNDTDSRSVVKEAIQNNTSMSGIDTTSIVNKPSDLYDFLIVHEVVRTNLRTGERYSFPYITSGNTETANFRDAADTRSKKSIPPAVTSDRYEYQVFTYIKDPLSALEKYITVGKKDDGKSEYFYTPIKWNNPKVVNTSTTYPEDDNNNPLIYDSFETWTPITQVPSYVIDAASIYADVTSVRALRLTREAVKVSWDVSIANSIVRQTSNPKVFYDSFLVFKQVNGRNGVRKFVGKTNDTFIYDYLSPMGPTGITDPNADLGYVYYCVIPILEDLTIDKTAYSNQILVSPDDGFFNDSGFKLSEQIQFATIIE